ncbi:hypothetical protein BCL93_1048 [Onishia taeanensis]|uniref:Uncharacterized protein n=1 Tax=Onishia taeanensis TaxID=284577 RepID=A0A328XTB2_9GAMM|nr:hypothetical protein BCL93_1048 [Halomonas taeanensis]
MRVFQRDPCKPAKKVRPDSTGHSNGTLSCDHFAI